MGMVGECEDVRVQTKARPLDQVALSWEAAVPPRHIT
jgi:hypothetical protein